MAMVKKISIDVSYFGGTSRFWNNIMATHQKTYPAKMIDEFPISDTEGYES